MTIEQFLNDNLKNIENDLSQMVAINSSLARSTATTNKPFGNGVFQSFNLIKKMCIKNKLTYTWVDGYAFIIELGQGDKEFAILHHIDVVGIFNLNLWKTNPFHLTKKNGFFYGRGVNDNKGPLIFSYYMLVYLKKIIGEKKLPMKLKIIIGGAEETTWAGIEYYKSKYKEPNYACSPDGNYPLVNIEKGVLKLQISKKCIQINEFILNSPKQSTWNCHDVQLNFQKEKIEFNSKMEKSRNPNRTIGQNAVDKAINYIMKYEKHSQIFDEIQNNILVNKDSTFITTSNKKHLGNSLCVTHINAQKDKISLLIDIRYDNSISMTNIITNIKNCKWQVNIKKHIDYHEVKENTILVKSLLNAYNDVMSESAKPLQFAGISYARAFKNAVVFGTTFPKEQTNSHGANENIKISSMIKSTKILYTGIQNIMYYINKKGKNEI